MPKFLLPRSEIGNAGQIPVNGQPVRVGEILIVFAVGVVVLLGGLRLFGNGPLASVLGIWMANLAMLSAIYWGLRSRGQQWDHLGLGLGLGLGFRADGFDFGLILSVFLRSLPVFVFAIMAFVAGAVLMANIFGVPEPADMSKYDDLQGNLALTLLALASVYVVSSFAEEVIYRGFLITRLIELGGGRRGAQTVAIVLSSLVFGLVHSEWGLPGMVQASCMGAALGVSYLMVGRNLWVTIFAHAYMDTILVLQMYLSG